MGAMPIRMLYPIDSVRHPVPESTVCEVSNPSTFPVYLPMPICKRPIKVSSVLANLVLVSEWCKIANMLDAVSKQGIRPVCALQEMNAALIANADIRRRHLTGCHGKECEC